MKVRAAIQKTRAALWFREIYKSATAARRLNAVSHAQGAEVVAQNARQRGDLRTAHVWEHHAGNCRRIARDIARRGAACTP